MRKLLTTGALVGLIALNSGCGSSVAAPTGASSSAAPAATSGTGQANSNRPRPTQLTGTIKAVNGSQVTLADGGSFAVDANTRITKSATVPLADLQSGQFAVLTAQDQPDGSLLASRVTVFAAAPGNSSNGFGPARGGTPGAGGPGFGGGPGRQSNATPGAGGQDGPGNGPRQGRGGMAGAIDQVTASGFSMTIAGDSKRVVLAPNAVISKEESGAAADLKAGTSVAAMVMDGTARSVTLQ